MILELQLQPKDRYRPATMEELTPFLLVVRAVRIAKANGELYFQKRPTRIVSIFPEAPLDPGDGEEQATIVGLEIDGAEAMSRRLESYEEAHESLTFGEGSYLAYLTSLADSAHLKVEYTVVLTETDEYLNQARTRGYVTPERYQAYLG